MAVIHAHELEVSRASSCPAFGSGLRVFGLTDPDRLDERVATYSFRLKNLPPRKVAEKLANRIFMSGR